MVRTTLACGYSGLACAFSFELRVVGLEGMRDVLVEDQAQDDVIVLGGILLPRSAAAICQCCASKLNVTILDAPS